MAGQLPRELFRRPPQRPRQTPASRAGTRGSRLLWVYLWSGSFGPRRMPAVCLEGGLRPRPHRFEALVLACEAAPFIAPRSTVIIVVPSRNEALLASASSRFCSTSLAKTSVGYTTSSSISKSSAVLVASKSAPAALNSSANLSSGGSGGGGGSSSVDTQWPRAFQLSTSPACAACRRSAQSSHRTALSNSGANSGAKLLAPGFPHKVQFWIFSGSVRLTSGCRRGL